MSECKCDLRTKLAGDGCEACNPALALEHAKERIRDLEGDYSTLLARHNALREAVKVALIDWDCCIIASQSTARDEVDRLIANESAADCKGEG